MGVEAMQPIKLYGPTDLAILNPVYASMTIWCTVMGFMGLNVSRQTAEDEDRLKKIRVPLLYLKTTSCSFCPAFNSNN